jgi:predicted SAM-dependent methyltransferase
MTSESDTCRDIFLPYLRDCRWMLDIGFGGSAICNWAITFDQERPYTKTGTDRQIMKGNCRDLSMFCDGAIDAIYSSHLLEDFSYNDQIDILKEWRRVLKVDGLLLINCPDQQKFLAHCARTGQGVNLAHVEQDYSLENFKQRVLRFSGEWEEVFVEPKHGAYSWLLIERKL